VHKRKLQGVALVAGCVILFIGLFLSGCVSSSKMDGEFYTGIKQGSKEYGEAIGQMATLIGMYEGSNSLISYSGWQDSIVEASTEVFGKAKFLYSITDTYCPSEEDILCDDIEDLYLKSRDMHGSLLAATKLESKDQMREVIRSFEDILALMESMSLE
jgi:hypothetical protein